MHPADRQTAMSSQTRSNTLPALLAFWSKILEFRSFHSRQCIRIAMVSKLRRILLGTPALACSHQSSVELKLSSGEQKETPRRSLKSLQTCCVNRQCTNRCVQFSGSDRHRGHDALAGQPRRRRLSAVRHLPCTASHMKNLHRAKQNCWFLAKLWERMLQNNPRACLHVSVKTITYLQIVYNLFTIMSILGLKIRIC